MSTIHSFITSFVFFFVGFIAAKARCRTSTLAIEIINSSLFYVAIPIIIFNSIYNAKDLSVLAIAIAISILHIAAVFIIAFGFTLMKRITDKSKAIAFSLSLAMPNVGYLAIPLSITLYNESESVIPYTIAFNIVLPMVILMLSFYSSTLSNSYEKIKLAIARSTPFLIAFILAFSLRYASVSLPKFLYTIFDVVKWYTLTSFALVGYEFVKTLYSNFTKRFVHELLISMIIRYTISPLLILIMITYLNLFEYRRGLILQSIMPPAVANIVLAKIFKLDTDVVSMLIVVLTPMSIALSFVLRILNIM